ncbi:MAG: carboxy terminal-processing peptidase [Pseudomonadaceae bacterium]|nr:carboxy terminal-processing peptidase [Pseudomonadaceae bacterium]
MTEAHNQTGNRSRRPRAAHSLSVARSIRRRTSAWLTSSAFAAVCFASSAYADSPQIALGTPTDTRTAAASPALTPLDVHPRTSLTIVEQLRHNHFLSKPLDDSASSEVFDKYLEMMDPAKLYFRADDITRLERYRFKLDDALKRGNLEAAFDVFNSFQERQIDRLEYSLKIIDEMLMEFDFTQKEYIDLDREFAAWPATQVEQDDLWRKRIKAAVLNMKLNGKELEEIQELLRKRYQNRLKQTAQTKSEDAFQLYINAFTSTYDPHTQYFSPRTSENFNINMSLSLEGIGAVLSSEDEYTSVVRLVPAGPADKGGDLKPSDRIVSVGQGSDGALIDVVGWRLDDVVEMIRGPKGSIVKLEVIPEDTEISRIVEITRNTVELEEQSAQKKLITMNRAGRDYRIGVIEVPTFYIDFKALQQGDPNFKSTTRDVRDLIDQLKAEDIDGLVIDLRNNGGGSLQEADALTGLFIKSGPTVQVKTAGRRPNIHSDTDDSVAWDGPLAVMVNRLSASASEIFAGAIQDYERGLIIGSQTFGKGTVQTLVPLNRGQLKITAAKYYRVSGQSTQHQGILPDIEFPELYDTSEIGESSLDDALPWDMIQPAVYPRGQELDSFLDGLRKNHSERIADDPDFRYLQAIVQRSELNRAREQLSLNEAERRAQKAADDAWRLELENTLRHAKGEEPYPDYAALEAADEAEAEAAADANSEEEEQDDALVRESGNILLDYIGLTRQVAYAETGIEEAPLM